jgi:murein DD-endopeptidase MepM/ murein hydrolase activator NlpD
MLGVRRKVVRRATTAIVVVALVSLPTTAEASPEAPTQEQDQASDDRSPVERAMVGVETLSVSSVNATLGELHAEITRQLELVGSAQAAVATANAALADADSALSNVRFRIEETTGASDAVVVEAFMNPPSSDALEVLTAETTEDATVKQALLDMQADDAADQLQAYDDALADLEVLEEQQESALAAAEAARSEAEAALDDLTAATSSEAQFVTQVQAALAQAQAQVPTDPAEAEAYMARLNEIATAMEQARETREIAAAQAAIEAERNRRITVGAMLCPVDGPVSFTNTWGAARSGGRRHLGVDMLAARGTPTVAPVSGEVQHRGSSLGGLSWYVYGDNGNMYYGTHLSGYENQGVGHVEAGVVIGYVGDTGNARGTPHLHFEVHPGGGAAVNPYPYVAEACR